MPHTMNRCPKCGCFYFETVPGQVYGTSVGEECKYGCGPVRRATDDEAEWWREPNKTETLAERLERLDRERKGGV